MLPLTAEYALRAVLYIADRGDGATVPVDAVAEALGLPRNYLSKTLNQLAKRGVLASRRGPAGGFRLRIAPDVLTLAQIIDGFAPEHTGRGCLLGRAECSDENPCPAHHRWKSVAERIRRFFDETTVAELLDPAEDGQVLADALAGRRERRAARAALDGRQPLVSSGPSGAR